MATDTISLETDYLVIGAGVSGMAFVDELLHNTYDVTVIIVDKHSKPGGHWNDAYNFVKLHQPAFFYGVNSKKLGHDDRDLACYSEINAYYELVMKEFLASGRVKFFPQCEYKGNGEIHSMMVPDLKYEVSVRKKTVDATLVGPTVPSTRKPEYEIKDGVNLVPINGLSHIKSPWKRYVIIGGGKTGIDAVLFLLNQSVNPDAITWVIPNDSWLINRDVMFPSTIASGYKTLFNCIMDSDTVDEYFKKGESAGIFLRLDPSIEPTRMKAGTVTGEELESLRLVKDIVRKGRISRIEATRIIFEDDKGEIETDNDTLHVDCSACGLPFYSTRKIFEGDKIMLQEIKGYHSAYSACVIAAYESYYPDDEEKKNKELQPIGHPHTPERYVESILLKLRNGNAIGKTLGFNWMRRCRLEPFHHISLFEFFKFFAYFVFYENTVTEALERILRRY